LRAFKFLITMNFFWRLNRIRNPKKN